MKRATRSQTKAGRAPRGVLSRALAVFTLVAFTLSGLLTQTHIHIVSAGAPAAIDIFDGVPAPSGPNKAPAKNDPANCPLCQQLASAGHFVTPAAAAMLLPALSLCVVEVAPVFARFVHTVTHHWRGRAPPKA